ncbi:hypothetical protein [Amycolatopsis sp. NPDC059657]|uniref:hypothetical protein n=1 Tax=Amycolatopsis sp. NPDC059657 TaxID=3346899 RepID=UPI00366AAD00
MSIRTNISDRLQVAGIAVALWLMACADEMRDRWNQARASGDAGSETVEKAVIVAIALALAVGLGAAITAAVQKYQAKIQ